MAIKNFHEGLNLGFLSNQTFNNTKILEYKGYKGSINQHEDGTYWGKVLNNPTSCCIYEGSNLQELEQDFKEMIDF